MIVHIRKRAQPYAQIDKRGLGDVRLTLAARGLYGWLMSMPANTRIELDWLVAQTPHGRQAIQTAFRNLAAHGYSRVEVIRLTNGQLGGRQWVLYEDPTMLTENKC